MLYIVHDNKTMLETGRIIIEEQQKMIDESKKYMPAEVSANLLPDFKIYRNKFYYTGGSKDKKEEISMFVAVNNCPRQGELTYLFPISGKISILTMLDGKTVNKLLKVLQKAVKAGVVEEW